MSTEEKFLEVESLLNRFLKLGWGSLITFVLIAFSAGTWIASLEIRAQEATEQLVEMEKDHRAFESFKAETTSNRYTAADHNKFSTGIQELQNQHDKRITRIEDSLTSVNKSLDRIEGKLGTK